jgi:hypothetical protein
VLPIVWAMDTLKPSLPATARLPALPWRLLLARFVTALQSLGRTHEDRFLAEAADLADLERRQRQVERDGLEPPRWPTG